MGHFQKSVTGSKSMCRSDMASSFQKMIFESVLALKKDWVIDVWSQCKNVTEEEEEKEDQPQVFIMDD